MKTEDYARELAKLKLMKEGWNVKRIPRTSKFKAEKKSKTKTIQIRGVSGRKPIPVADKGTTQMDFDAMIVVYVDHDEIFVANHDHIVNACGDPKPNKSKRDLPAVYWLDYKNVRASWQNNFACISRAKRKTVSPPKLKAKAVTSGKSLL